MPILNIDLLSFKLARMNMQLPLDTRSMTDPNTSKPVPGGCIQCQLEPMAICYLDPKIPANSCQPSTQPHAGLIAGWDPHSGTQGFRSRRKVSRWWSLDLLSVCVCVCVFLRCFFLGPVSLCPVSQQSLECRVLASWSRGQRALRLCWAPAICKKRTSGAVCRSFWPLLYILFEVQVGAKPTS